MPRWSALLCATPPLLALLAAPAARADVSMGTGWSCEGENGNDFASDPLAAGSWALRSLASGGLVASRSWASVTFTSTLAPAADSFVGIFAAESPPSDACSANASTSIAQTAQVSGDISSVLEVEGFPFEVEWKGSVPPLPGTFVTLDVEAYLGGNLIGQGSIELASGSDPLATGIFALPGIQITPLGNGGFGLTGGGTITNTLGLGSLPVVDSSGEAELALQINSNVFSPMQSVVFTATNHLAQFSAAFPQAPGLVVTATPIAAFVPTPFTKDERRCARAMNVGGAAVVKGAERDVRGCIKAKFKGRLDPQTVDACFLSGEPGKRGKAERKLIRRFDRKCGAVDPPFGFAGPVGVSAGADHVYTMAAEVFGDPVDAAIVSKASDPRTGKCQKAALGAAFALVDASLGRANKAKKQLQKSAEPATDRRRIEDALLAGLESPKLAKPSARLAKVVSRACQKGTSPALAFPGCQATTPAELAACLAREARCAACTSLNATDALAMDCDLLDDGLPQQSCPTPIGM